MVHSNSGIVFSLEKGTAAPDPCYSVERALNTWPSSEGKLVTENTCYMNDPFAWHAQKRANSRVRKRRERSPGGYMSVCMCVHICVCLLTVEEFLLGKMMKMF